MAVKRLIRNLFKIYAKLTRLLGANHARLLAAVQKSRTNKGIKMRFFSLKSCDTCRKAQKQIIATNQSIMVIDVRVDGVSNADLTQIIALFGDQAINRASTTWRGLSDAEKQGDPATLLALNPTLMKRPVIEKNGVWTIGWKPDVAAQVLDT